MNDWRNSSALGDHVGRRQWLQLTAGGWLGLNLPGLFRARAAQNQSPKVNGSIRSCIFIFYYGGPSHLDSLDPKPEAPAEVRGEFRSIATTVPGVRVCEHLPRLAKTMHKVALVRTMHHQLTAHDPASGETLTGHTPLSGNRPQATDTFPSHGACLTHLWRKKRLPLCHAALPFVMNNNGVRNPGQGPGFLGAACAPLEIAVDPIAGCYRADALQARPGLSPDRLDGREVLLNRMNRIAQTKGPGSTETASLSEHYKKAFELLRSEAVRHALDISREDPKVRERYGLTSGNDYTTDGVDGSSEHAFARNMRGQNLLLARRLVEAGVPFVNVYDFKHQGRNWDTHRNNFVQLRDYLLPSMDLGLPTLLDDLDTRGLLDSTLVVAVGEFGRSPRISKLAGRDHWPTCYSAMLAGGGIRGGAVHGKSDRIGAFPEGDAVGPADLAATIFWRFGLDPATELHDLSGRPYPLAAGQPLQRLF